MLMMYHVHDVETFYRRSVQLRMGRAGPVGDAPAHERTPQLVDEPLVEAGLVEDPRDGTHFVVYKVTSGSISTKKAYSRRVSKIARCQIYPAVRVEISSIRTAY